MKEFVAKAMGIAGFLLCLVPMWYLISSGDYYSMSAAVSSGEFGRK
jgi:hypothetical protein